MAIQMMLNEGNFEEFIVCYPVIDDMVPELQGSNLSRDQMKKIIDMLKHVRIFREAFEINGWNFENTRMSIPLFFILSDLCASYDDSVNYARRIHDNLENLIEGNSSGLHPHIRNLRKDLLGHHMEIAKNTIARNANKIIDLFHDIVNYLHREFDRFQ